jgi:hypothetical protein
MEKKIPTPGVALIFTVPESCTRQLFRQWPLRNYAGICKLIHSYVHMYVQKKASSRVWDVRQLECLAHAFHSGQLEYFHSRVWLQHS